MYRVSKLNNGITVATSEMPHMTSVSLGIWIGVGSRYESAELNGVCHFIEHLLFKGTKKRSAKEISEAVEGIGGSLNAFTSEENTCFHCRAAHGQFEHLLEVLVDMWRTQSLRRRKSIKSGKSSRKRSRCTWMNRNTRFRNSSTHDLARATTGPTDHRHSAKPG